MRAVLLVAGVLAAPAGAAAQVKAPTAPAVERWDLRRFEAEALKRSPVVGEAADEMRLHRARRMEAAWARFPTFSWQSVVSPIPELRGDVIVSRTPTNVFLGFAGVFQQHKLDIFLPIFTFGKLRNAKRAAEAGIVAARWGVERARADVVRDVRKAYYSVQVAREVMRVVEEGWERIVSAEKKLEELLEKGSKEVEELDKNRLATFSADVATRRQEAIRFRDLSIYALRVAAGVPQSTPVDIDPAPLSMLRVSVPPVETLIETAVRERPELRALEAGIAARQALVSLQKSQYFPDFFIAGTVGIARCNVCDDQLNPFVFDPFNLDLYGAVLGVRLTLDYGQKVARVRQAEAELARLQRQHERLLEGIRLEVRKAYLEWKQVKEQVASIKKGRKYAQGWLFQSTINFNTGLSKLRDLTDALAAWFKFRLEEIRSVYHYNVAVAQLEHAVGRPLPAPSR